MGIKTITLVRYDYCENATFVQNISDLVEMGNNIWLMFQIMRRENDVEFFIHHLQTSIIIDKVDCRSMLNWLAKMFRSLL